MSIKGNLKTFHLSSLLQMLNYERKTGKLKIKSESNEVEIFLHEATSCLPQKPRKPTDWGSC